MSSSRRWQVCRESSIGGSTMLAADPCRRRCAAWRKLAGLAPRIRWHGPLSQEEVLHRYREADLFVLASRIAADGDRDGLPNVLLEAQSQALAVIASNFSGIAELVEDAVTGRLVKPADPLALAEELVMLIRDPALRLHLGGAGQERVFSRFSQQAGSNVWLRVLASRLRAAHRRGRRRMSGRRNPARPHPPAGLEARGHPLR